MVTGVKCGRCSGAPQIFSSDRDLVSGECGTWSSARDFGSGVRGYSSSVREYFSSLREIFNVSVYRRKAIILTYRVSCKTCSLSIYILSAKTINPNTKFGGASNKVEKTYRIFQSRDREELIRWSVKGVLVMLLIVWGLSCEEERKVQRGSQSYGKIQRLKKGLQKGNVEKGCREEIEKDYVNGVSKGGQSYGGVDL